MTTHFVILGNKNRAGLGQADMSVSSELATRAADSFLGRSCEGTRYQPQLAPLQKLADGLTSFSSGRLSHDLGVGYAERGEAFKTATRIWDSVD